MHDNQQPRRFDALEKATRAAGISISLVMRVPTALRPIADQVIRSASSVAAQPALGWRASQAEIAKRDRH